MSVLTQQADGGDEIETLRRHASQLSREGRFAEAVPIWRRALMLAERLSDILH
jgi:hypothetical protein